jgi:hypothetical protein
MHKKIERKFRKRERVNVERERERECIKRD